MSKDLHDIDDLFKKALEENTEHASSLVWENVEKSLDKRKVVSISKKYYKLKWTAAILLLFSLGMAMYTLHVKKQNSELVNQTKKARSNNKSNPSHSNNSDSLNTAFTDRIKQKIIPAELPGYKNIKADSAKVLVKKDTAEQGHTFADNINKNESVLKDSLYKKAMAEKATNSNIYSSIKNSSIPGHSSTDKTLATDISINAEGTHNRFTSPMPGQYVNIAIERGIDAKAMEPGLKNDNTLVVNKISLPFNKKFFLKNHLEDNKKALITTRISLRKNTGSPFSFTAFYSPDIVTTNIKNDHPQFREEERDEIKKDEDIQFSSTTGLLFNYSISSKWKLESGITYSTRKTNIEPKTIYARPDNNGHINYQFDCSAGYAFVTVNAPPMPVSGDSIHALSSENTLNYIGIPLLIRYVLNTGKWNLIPSIGASLNFLTKGQIETTIPDPAGSKTETSNKIQGLKSSYVSGMISFAAQYNLNRFLGISFEPTSRFAVTAINNNTPVKTNLNSFGFVTGLVIKF